MKAFIVLRKGFGEGVTEDDILRFCEEKLESYKVPRFIEFRENLPKTNIGEVFKRALREESVIKEGELTKNTSV